MQSRGTKGSNPLPSSGESPANRFLRRRLRRPGDLPGCTAALRAEVAKMIELIRPEDFAIQWDLAVENRYIVERPGRAR